MQYALAAAALIGMTVAFPQGGPPPQPASSSCMSSYPGTFNIQVVNVTSSSKRSEKRQTDSSGANTLKIQLNDGKLTDSEGRTGYIASNHQFQFDPKPQPNALISSGWAVCPNNTLVLGSDAVFKECLSGKFYNLYDQNGAGQCSPIYIEVINGQGGNTGSSPASQQSDGQVTATPGAVSQITDGQVQATTPAKSGMPVSQITDGQIQASTGVAPVTQITDGQIQAPTSTGKVVTQITDGQIQAPTAAVSQITDGQVQAPTGAAVSQIGDGQIQSNGSAPAQPSVQAYTGSASSLASSIALVASIGALAFFL